MEGFESICERGRIGGEGRIGREAFDPMEAGEEGLAAVEDFDELRFVGGERTDGGVLIEGLIPAGFVEWEKAAQEAA